MPGVLTGFDDATAQLSDPNALRALAQRDGFLFFKDFLPQALLVQLRRQILEIVDRYGWIKKGTDLMQGIGDLEAIAQTDADDQSLQHLGVTEDAYREVQCLELFHTIPHHPKLIALYETLFQAEVLPHPRHIARVLLPAPSFHATPIHQDFIHIQGTTQTWTCWFPLGDCPMAMGNLSILKGSHRAGLLKVAEAEGAGGLEAIVCQTDRQWVQGDFALGDLVTFHSYTIHKALPSQLPERIRLSLDLRYQAVHDVIEQKSLLPHTGVTDWETIYQDWDCDQWKYYWKRYDLQITPWDEVVRWQKEQICD